MPLWAKEKGAGVWDLKGEKGRWEDQIFGEQRFAVPGRDNRTWRGIWISRPNWASCQLITPRPYSLFLSKVIFLFLNQAFYLNSFRQVREKQKLFLNLANLDFLQLKIVHLPKWHILERLALNPFRIIEMPCVIKRKILFHPCALICFRILFLNFFPTISWENHSYLFWCMASDL